MEVLNSSRATSYISKSKDITRAKLNQRANSLLVSPDPAGWGVCPNLLA